ncbi:MAG: hypothetical protein LE178_01745 [Endomicrobium sp.]|nr:hypothetical protein [Endomicrobium sp.]
MVKKMVLFVCGLFFFCYFSPIMSFAGNHCCADSKMGVTEKDKIESTANCQRCCCSTEKDKIEFTANLNKLIEKYNVTTGAEKDAVKKDIRNLVDSNLNKDVAFKKALIAKKQEKIANIEKELASIEADRKKYIDDKVDYFISKNDQTKARKIKKNFLTRKKMTSKKLQLSNK